ncbi:ethanolamine-phosphate phospho-lyase-like [Artemia franciscana]|uniref:Alanine-glyoxylate aminotransferase n=1 Tax=Artemia franciscana TaxID=6661 RepID=A0AA88L1H3_ARTSF|nr:hypothetical protein QYM36_017524 [Artemia franciscana]
MELLFEREDEPIVIRRPCALQFDSDPIHLARASKQYIYDTAGNEYLDASNNTAHVGHCHPHVVSAGQSQMARAACSQGYVCDVQKRYLKKLLETLPEKLSVCFLLNSGSEANDLALRLARRYTGGDDIVVFENTYHGNLSSLIEISPKLYRYEEPRNRESIHVIPLPDSCHIERENVPHETDRLVQEARSLIQAQVKRGRSIAGFLSEIIVVNAGVVVPPNGYYQGLYRAVREAGGLCIADEVQTGLGRMGEHFWAFQQHGVLPDIITIGKQLGNGYPLAAVITTRDIADSIGDFVSTYGGNPVACSMGLAVLEVIQNEQMQSSCTMVGYILKEGLVNLKARYSCIGSIRGSGLCLGVEIVGYNSGNPDPFTTNEIKDRMKAEKILLISQGPDHNVLVITPPMCFTTENARRFLRSFESVLAAIQSEGFSFKKVRTHYRNNVTTSPDSQYSSSSDDENPRKRFRALEDLD